MKKIMLPLVLLLIAACRNSRPDPAEIAGKPYAMALVIGNPIDYGEHGLLIFPIGANYNPKIGKKVEEVSARTDGGMDKAAGLANNHNFATTSNGFVENQSVLWDSRANKEYVNQNEEDFDIRNILFYDKLSGASYILSVDTMHVLSFSIHKEFDNPLIFYRVVKMDINKDGKYNSTDAVMLYVSDMEGKDFIQVTPENEQFFDYFYYPETQSILIKTAIDIDKNSRFTALDETNFREMRLSKPAFGKEIFTRSMKDSLKNQMSILK
jgi:hypothetical protein